jgi:hypothetical protein
MRRFACLLFLCGGCALDAALPAAQYLPPDAACITSETHGRGKSRHTVRFIGGEEVNSLTLDDALSSRAESHDANVAASRQTVFAVGSVLAGLAGTVGGAALLRRSPAGGGAMIAASLGLDVVGVIAAVKGNHNFVRAIAAYNDAARATQRCPPPPN